MRDGAYLVMLMRLGMLMWSEENDQMSDAQRTLWTKTYPDFLGVAPIGPRPSFTDDGKTDAQEYGIGVWQKGQGLEDNHVASLWPRIIWKKPLRRPRRKSGG